LNHGRILIP